MSCQPERAFASVWKAGIQIPLSIEEDMASLWRMHGDAVLK
ncbi:hypothetical protein ACB102_11765 [Aneurinibacillus sp. REN35]